LQVVGCVYIFRNIGAAPNFGGAGWSGGRWGGVVVGWLLFIFGGERATDFEVGDDNLFHEVTEGIKSVLNDADYALGGALAALLDEVGDGLLDGGGFGVAAQDGAVLDYPEVEVGFGAVGRM
jgi:hypothetical protein